MKKAFTLVELLVSIAIIALIVAVSVNSFVNFRKDQTVDSVVSEIRSFVEKAQQQTIEERNGFSYGIRFATTTVTIFKGDAYSSADPNNISFSLGTGVQLSKISLTDATTTVLFAEITGDASATGTIVVSSTVDKTSSTTLTLYSSGIIQ